MKRLLILIVAVAVVAAVGYGYRSRIRLKPDTTSADTPGPAAGATAAVTPRADVSIDSRRQQLIGVRTAPARRVSLAQTIRTTGYVRADETRQTDINLKIERWIRDLYVDYT